MRRGVAGLLLALMVWTAASAQTAPDPQHPGSFLLTVFLRHDESKPLGAINQELQKNGWFHDFPPPGVEIVSWYVMMGIGQVVTLRVPAEKLREVNRIIESSAWGGFRTEFYPTYDYRQAWEEQKQKLGGP